MLSAPPFCEPHFTCYALQFLSLFCLRFSGWVSKATAFIQRHPHHRTHLSLQCRFSKHQPNVYPSHQVSLTFPQKPRCYADHPKSTCVNVASCCTLEFVTGGQSLQTVWVKTLYWTLLSSHGLACVESVLGSVLWWFKHPTVSDIYTSGFSNDIQALVTVRQGLLKCHHPPDDLPEVPCTSRLNWQHMHLLLVFHSSPFPTP